MNNTQRKREDCRFGIRYKFTGSMDALEEWITGNNKGGFWYELADVHETDSPFGQLEVIFHFELSEDRERFKDKARTGPVW